MSKVALLDGDSWVYRCGFAAEKTKYLLYYQQGKPDTGEIYERFDSSKDMNAYAKTNGMSWFEHWTRKEIEPLENCLQMVKSSLENTLNVLGVKDYELFISGRNNFRDDIFPEYKANRDGVAKPKYYRDIRDYLVGTWNGHILDGIEADDALGIAASANPESIVVAVDKDLDQIPGDHYNWTTGDRYVVTKQDGLRFFYEQLLSGDPTDNIPGITGIGPVKAKKALAAAVTPKNCAEIVTSMYCDFLRDNPDVPGTAYTTIERNASLLWIQRAPNQRHPFFKHLEM